MMPVLMVPVGGAMVRTRGAESTPVDIVIFTVTSEISSKIIVNKLLKIWTSYMIKVSRNSEKKLSRAVKSVLCTHPALPPPFPLYLLSFSPPSLSPPPPPPLRVTFEIILISRRMAWGLIRSTKSEGNKPYRPSLIP